jgi:hypothetical protein
LDINFLHFLADADTSAADTLCLGFHKTFTKTKVANLKTKKQLKKVSLLFTANV